MRTAVGWSALDVWGTQSMNLAVFAILVRLLEPSVFGLIALAAVFVSLAKSFVDQGMSTAIVQRRDITDVQLDSVFWTSVCVGVTFSVAGFVLAGPIASLFSEPLLADVVRWLSIVFVIDALGTVQQGLLRRRFAFRSLAVRAIIAVCAGGTAGVAMAMSGWGVESLVVQQIVTAAVGVLLLWHLEPWKPRFRFHAESARDLLAFGYNILGIRLLTFASRRSDDLLVGYFLGTVALGYYAVAYKIYKVLLDLLAAVVARVALPAFASVQGESDQFRNSVASAVQAVALLAFPVFGGLAVLAPEIVTVVFGASWEASGPVMRILAVAGITQSLSLICQQAFIAHGQPAWAFRLTLASTIALVAAFMVTAQNGITWVAAAFGAVGILLLPVQLLALRTMVGFGFGQLAAACRAPLAGAAFMVAGLILWQMVAGGLSPLPRLVLAMFIGGPLYIGGVFFVDRRIVGHVLRVLKRSPRGRSAALTPTVEAP